MDSILIIQILLGLYPKSNAKEVPRNNTASIIQTSVNAFLSLQNVCEQSAIKDLAQISNSIIVVAAGHYCKPLLCCHGKRAFFYKVPQLLKSSNSGNIYLTS